MKELKFIDANQAGRDFIVGDLHGCKSLLMLALAQVDFNPSVDRVFCTGDLVDRGPESFDTLCLLEEPWFFTVAGNHEQMLLRLLADDCLEEDLVTFAANGGDWFFRLNDAQLFHLKDVLQEKLEALPMVLRVASAHGAFQVAHAELCDLSGKTLTDIDLENAPLGDLSASIQWGRSRINPILKSGLLPEATGNGVTQVEPRSDEGLTLTYVGHTIVPYPILYKSHCYLDAGANRGYRNKYGYLALLEHGKELYSAVQAGDLALRKAA